MAAGLCLLSSMDPFSYPIAVITDSTDYIGNGSGEVVPRMELVREQNNYTKLILGDSVSNQIFDSLQANNTEYCIATSNRAITMAGQYILAEQFVENNPDATDIYLIIILDTLETKIDTTYGYQYVVIPFTETDALELLDPETLSYMRELYGSFFMNPQVIKGIGSSGLNRKLYLNLIDSDFLSEREERVINENMKYESLSTTAWTYLQKIKVMCEEKDVTLHVIPGPLADTTTRKSQMARLEQEFTDSGLVELFPDYFNQILFYPESDFRDGIHFKEEFETHEYFNQVIRDMQRVTDSMEDLKLYNENLNGE